MKCDDKYEEKMGKERGEDGEGARRRRDGNEERGMSN